MSNYFESSEKYKDNLAKTLKSTLNTVDKIYDSMRAELRKELMMDKENREQRDEDTQKVYGKLNWDICRIILKRKLPFSVRLLNKYKCHGFGVRGPGFIVVHFTLGGRRTEFELVLSVQEVNRLLGFKQTK